MSKITTNQRRLTNMDNTFSLAVTRAPQRRNIKSRIEDLINGIGRGSSSGPIGASATSALRKAGKVVGTTALAVGVAGIIGVTALFAYGNTVRNERETLQTLLDAPTNVHTVVGDMNVRAGWVDELALAIRTGDGIIDALGNGFGRGDAPPFERAPATDVLTRTEPDRGRD